MDLVFVVRHKVLVDGRSARDVAYDAASGGTPVLDAVRGRLEALLQDAPRWTGGKQRLTATRLHRMLLCEGHRVGVTLVKAFVAEWRRQRQEVFVPLVYRPGDLAEVDFFEVLVDVAGRRRKAWMFVMRLMHSGRDFAWLYDRQDQVSFLEGRARAFEHFGAVPLRLVYDNLRAAVTKILVGSERKLAVRFEALAAHYVFEPCSRGRAPGMTRAESRREARASASSTSCRSPRATARRDQRGAGRAPRAPRRGAARCRGPHDRRPLCRRARTHAAGAGALVPAHRVTLAGASRRSLVKVEGAVYSVPCEWPAST